MILLIRPDIQKLLRKACFTLICILTAIVFGVRAAGQEKEKKIEARITPGFLMASNPRDAISAGKAYAQNMAEKLEKDIGKYDFHIDIALELDKLVEEMNNGKVDGAYVNPYEYVKLREKAQVIPIARIIRKGEYAGNKAVLVANVKTGAKKLSDLRGKSFIYFSELSVPNYLYPQWLLIEKNLPTIENFFGKMIKVSKEKSALLAVIYGKADVTSVSEILLSTITELSPALAKRIRIIEKSESYPDEIFVMRKNLDPNVVKHLREYMVKEGMETDAKTKQLFELWKIKGFAEVEDGEYDKIRNLIEIIESSRKQFVDPVSGRALSKSEVKAIIEMKAGTLHFESEETKKTHLGRVERAKPGAENPIALVVFPRDNLEGRKPRDFITVSTRYYEKFKEEIGFEAFVEIVPSIEIMEEMVKEKMITFVNPSGAVYVFLHERLGLEPLVRYEKSDPNYRSVLITSSKSGIEKMADLRGKSLALQSGGEAETELFIMALIKALGKKSIDDFFGSVISCPSEEAAMKAVIFGQADCACVKNTTLDMLGELNPGLRKRIKILAQSEKFVLGPLCYHSNTPADIMNKLKKHLLNAHNTDKARELLTFFGVKKAVEAKDSDYDGVRKMLDALERGK